MAQTSYYATGKRKTAVARVWLKSGSGRFLVNKRDFDEYFPVEANRLVVQRPLVLTSTAGQFDIRVNVTGGGPAGQAGAVRHGISKALLEVNSEFRAALKKEGMITRDSREKERKKYGQRGARARFQFSKR